MMDIAERLDRLRTFLAGAGSLNGRWFGDDVKPRFWWRKELVRIDDAAAEITRLRAENERLREALDGLLKTIDAPGYILREQQAIECLGSDTPLSRARAALHHPRQAAEKEDG